MSVGSTHAYYRGTPQAAVRTTRVHRRCVLHCSTLLHVCSWTNRGAAVRGIVLSRCRRRGGGTNVIGQSIYTLLFALLSSRYIFIASVTLSTYVAYFGMLLCDICLVRVQYFEETFIRNARFREPYPLLPQRRVFHQLSPLPLRKQPPFIADGACDPSPCNGGTCTVDPGGGYMCSSCPTDFGGMHCQLDTSGERSSRRKSPHDPIDKKSGKNIWSPRYWPKICITVQQ